MPRTVNVLGFKYKNNVQHNVMAIDKIQANASHICYYVPQPVVQPILVQPATQRYCILQTRFSMLCRDDDDDDDDDVDDAEEEVLT